MGTRYGPTSRPMIWESRVRHGPLATVTQPQERLDPWYRVDSESADAFELDLASKVNTLLDGYQTLPDDGGPSSDV